MDKIKLPIEWHDLAEEFLDADGQIITIDRITDALNTAADKDRQIADVIPARKALDRQQQLDESGVMVGVSRQAVDEVCAFIDALADDDKDRQIEALSRQECSDNLAKKGYTSEEVDIWLAGYDYANGGIYGLSNDD